MAYRRRATRRRPMRTRRVSRIRRRRSSGVNRIGWRM